MGGCGCAGGCVSVHIIWSVCTRENAFGLSFIPWSRVKKCVPSEEARVASLSAPHSSQTPRVCAAGTFWRRFWSSFCTGISLHPSGSAGGPSGWICLQTPGCSEGKKKASPLGRGRGGERDGQCLRGDTETDTAHQQPHSAKSTRGSKAG